MHGRKTQKDNPITYIQTHGNKERQEDDMHVLQEYIRIFWRLNVVN